MALTPEIQPPNLADEKQRIEKLKDPNLLYNIVKEIQKDGVIGEEPTLLVLINKIFLRLTFCTPTSSNLIVSDETGGGKDYTVKKTCNVIIPNGKYHHLTDMSPKTFDYWKPTDGWGTNEQGKKYPIYSSWDEHVIHLEDPNKDALDGQSFKVMSSGGTNVVKIIDNKAKQISVEGKPVIIVTSLNTLVDNEGLRRWDTCRIDTSVEQTKKINKFKLLKASNKVTSEPDTVLRDALHKNLYKKNVIIPKALDLFELIPDNIITRTQTDKLLDYVRSSAILHQYQREHDGATTVISNEFDIAYGWYVFTTLNSSQSIPLNKDEEELVNVLKNQHGPITINELSDEISHTRQWIYHNKEKFVNKGLIKTVFLKKEVGISERDVEHVLIGKNVMTIVNDFQTILKYPSIYDCNHFNHFKNIIIKLENDRQSNGLLQTFVKMVTIVNTSENTTLQSFENDVTKENFENLSQHEKINCLKNYCTEKDGKILTYENLCFHFSQNFIERCKKNKILIPNPRGGYCFQST